MLCCVVLCCVVLCSVVKCSVVYCVWGEEGAEKKRRGAASSFACYHPEETLLDCFMSHFGDVHGSVISVLIQHNAHVQRH